jgi:hypothetical protein
LNLEDDRFDIGPDPQVEMMESQLATAGRRQALEGGIVGSGSIPRKVVGDMHLLPLAQITHGYMDPDKASPTDHQDFTHNNRL